MITIEKKYASKVERYLKNHFSENIKDKMRKTNIELVVFSAEEGPVNVLVALEKRIT